MDQSGGPTDINDPRSTPLACRVLKEKTVQVSVQKLQYILTYQLPSTLQPVSCALVVLGELHFLCCHRTYCERKLTLSPLCHGEGPFSLYNGKLVSYQFLGCIDPIQNICFKWHFWVFLTFAENKVGNFSSMQLNIKGSLDICCSTNGTGSICSHLREKPGVSVIPVDEAYPS